MSSKRYKKLPEKTLDLAPELAEKLLPTIKKNCTSKIDQSIDLSFQINNKQKKSEINIRTVVNLPGGSGKNVKVAVVCEDSKTSDAEVVLEDLVARDILHEKGVVDFVKHIDKKRGRKTAKQVIQNLPISTAKKKQLANKTIVQVILFC